MYDNVKVHLEGFYSVYIRVRLKQYLFSIVDCLKIIRRFYRKKILLLR